MQVVTNPCKLVCDLLH